MTLRWGIVSAGKISHDFVNALNSFPEKVDQAVVAVAARDKGRAAEFAKKHSIPKVFDTYEDLAKSNDIDIAYIGALNPSHYQLTMLFLNNGKHVLCEKPFSLNFKQSQSMINLARKNNLFVMEAVWSRFSPAYIQLENEINEGKLGDIKFVEANLGLNLSEDIDRIRLKELGGGAILDLGIYVLQFAQYIFKEAPVKVTTVGSLYDTGVDEGETIILEYSNGRRAVLNAHTKVELVNKGTVYGTKGMITVEPVVFPVNLTGVDGTVHEHPAPKPKLECFFGISTGLAYQTVEVARCIKEGLIESPRMPHSETLLLAKLMDTVRSQLGVHFNADDQEYP